MRFNDKTVPEYQRNSFLNALGGAQDPTYGQLLSPANINKDNKNRLSISADRDGKRSSKAPLPINVQQLISSDMALVTGGAAQNRMNSATVD